MQEYLSSRSRREDTLRCPRARWVLHEAQGRGWELVRRAVPLVTGYSVHAGLADLLRTAMKHGTSIPFPGDIDQAVQVALQTYDSDCEGRGLDLGELEDQSWVFQESRALVEALVRLAGLRVIPTLLQTYEVLEVEQLDKASLYKHQTMDLESVGWIENPPEWEIIWRSIPDALLRSRASGGLFILSWKTVGEYSIKTDDAARVDMQGMSEMWALGERLRRYENSLVWKRSTGKDLESVPEWFSTHKAQGGSSEIRGIQMVYLVKGQRRKAGKDLQGAVALATSNPQVEVYKTGSPLIYGYQDKSFPPKLAWASEWRCTSPHPMRKSSWYPSGECPGDGRNHKRPDDWTSFPVWHAMGVKAWMAQLASGMITPEAGDPLEQSYAIPVPYFRTRGEVERWLRQTRSAEKRVVHALQGLREIESALQEERRLESQGLATPHMLEDLLEKRLDEAFEQNTSQCAQWFGRKCPAWEICHGPEHVRQDPQGSGIYQIKTPYKETVEPVEVTNG